MTKSVLFQFVVVDIVKLEVCTSKSSKIGIWSNEARVFFNKSSDRKNLIKHHPFDKANVYQTGIIHHMNEKNKFTLSFTQTTVDVNELKPNRTVAAWHGSSTHSPVVPFLLRGLYSYGHFKSVLVSFFGNAKYNNIK